MNDASVRDIHSYSKSYTKYFVRRNAELVLPSEVKGFSDVDQSNLFNIDEISVDTTKRSRIKVLCMAEKQKTQCVSYHRTFEGDGDDENSYDEYGAIPPCVIHANKSKVRKDDKPKSSKYDEDE
eukprot:7951823-Ditylum_brightwellii.AAC.1